MPKVLFVVVVVVITTITVFLDIILTNNTLFYNNVLMDTNRMHAWTSPVNWINKSDVSLLALCFNLIGLVTTLASGTRLHHCDLVYGNQWIARVWDRYRLQVVLVQV